MKAYLMSCRDSKLFLVFGENAVAAGNELVEKFGFDLDQISVGGSWDVDPKTPIVVSNFWPYFTNNPPSNYD